MANDEAKIPPAGTPDPAPPGEGFRPACGAPGWIYCPAGERPRKHPCADCGGCNFCSDARCAVCLNRRGGKAAEARDGAAEGQPPASIPPTAAP